MNYLKTGMLLAFMTALFMAIGWAIGGQQGMVIAFLFALGMNAFTYWNADKLVLRMHGARQVGPQDAPDFYRVVERLANRAQMPMPKVFIIDTQQPNAFATGRNPENASVAATTGLLGILSKRELAGVMAHELGHVKNRDTLIMTLTATIAGAISMLSNMAFFMGGNRQNRSPLAGILVMFIAPFAAMLVQFAISRTREYAADHSGAEISGDPEALAAALAKIQNAARGIVNPYAERNPATAHMFIINPLSGQRMDNLFSTHPNTQNRIDALMKLSGGASQSSRPAPKPTPKPKGRSFLPSSPETPWNN